MRQRVLSLLLVTLTLAACAPTPEPPPPPGDVPVARTFKPMFDGSTALPPTDLTDDGPGSLVSVAPLDGNVELDDVEATVRRVIFRSTSGVDNSATEVSGIVAIPPGKTPKGGWPIIAFGHGTTGVLNKCAPSDFPSLVGNGPMMASMILNGFAVAMPDYQGLGVKGYTHPFLDSPTFGNNMIDAVRAARRLSPEISDRWIAFGHSLGGLAAWAAADRAGVYGQGLDLVATLAMAPVADMSGLVDKAVSGTMTREQMVSMMFVLQSLSWSHPDLDLSRYRRGYTADHWDALLDCLSPDLNELLHMRLQMNASDLKPETPADAARLKGLLQGMALPRNRTSSPMKVMYGTNDVLVDTDWTESALGRACAQGDAIEIEKRVGQGHNDLESAEAFPWIRDRLDGQATPNSCPGAS